MMLSASETTAAEMAQARPGRGRRLTAFAVDCGSGLLALLAGVLLAAVWLLLRSGLGLIDAPEGDAVVAAAVAGATAPAWAAWLFARSRRRGATFGEGVAGLGVAEREGHGRPSGRRRSLRLALHPLSLPLWGWLALTALLSGLPWAWAPPLLVVALVALGGVGSLALLLVRPSAPALHDRVAGTRLFIRMDGARR